MNVGGDPKLLKPQWVCRREMGVYNLRLMNKETMEWVDALFLTSGTTEVARVVGHRQQALTACAKEMAEVLGLQSDSRVALTLPLSFHYGFSVFTSTFASGATLLLPSTPSTDATFVFHLNEWLQTSNPSVLATVPQGWAIFARILSDTVWQSVDTMVSAGDLITCPNYIISSNKIQMETFTFSMVLQRYCERVIVNGNHQIQKDV